MSLEQIKAYIYLTVAMIIVGSSVVLGKLMVEKIPVFLASGLRFAIASFFLFIILLVVEKKIPRLTKKDVSILFFQSFTGVFLFSICLLYGVQYTTAMESGIITSTTPIMIGILSFFILKEKISKHVVIGIVFVVIGISIINLVNGNGEAGGDFPMLGNILVMFAVIGEALFTILGKLLSKKLSPLAISTFITFIGFLLFLPFAIYEAVTFDFHQMRVVDWGYVLYFAIVVTVFAFYLWYSGVSKVTGSTSGVFTGVLPISSIILSYIILKEQLAWIHLIGVFFVLVGIISSSFVKKKRQYKNDL